MFVMKKIKSGLYEIERNQDLIAESKQVLSNPLPTNYYDKHDAFMETADILNRIIKDRSDKIDEGMKDFISGKPLESFADLECRFILDKVTEKTINALFDREEVIHRIEPNPDYIIVKVVRSK